MKLFQKSFTLSFEDEKRRGGSTLVNSWKYFFLHILNQAGLEPPHNQIHDVDCAQIQFVQKKKPQGRICNYFTSGLLLHIFFVYSLSCIQPEGDNAWIRLL